MTPIPQAGRRGGDGEERHENTARSPKELEISGRLGMVLSRRVAIVASRDTMRVFLPPRRLAVFLAASVAVNLAACAKPPSAVVRAAEPKAVLLPRDATPTERSVEGKIRLDRPDELDVSLTFTGAPSELDELNLLLSSPLSVSRLEIRDDSGAVPFAMSAEGPGTVVRLERPMRGRLNVTYRLAIVPANFDDPVMTTASPDRLRLSGETALLLPTLFDETMLNVELTFQLDAIPHADVASNFGHRHPARVICRGAELRHATFLGGRTSFARFETGVGEDEWVWLEELGFDARPVAGEFAALRTQLATYFEAGDQGTFTTLVSANVRPDGAFAVLRRPRGLLLQLSIDVGWSAPVRIAVARELFRPWLGYEVRLQSDESEDRPRDLWFNEGVARALARELLYRFRTLSREEYRVEINDLIGTILLSSHRKESLGALAERAKTDSEARHVLIARGALYWTLLDLELRPREGTRGADFMIRELFTLVRARQRPLGLADWFEMLRPRFGDDAQRAFTQIVEQGQIPSLPPSALGRCFRLGTNEYAGFSLGFDLAATRARDDLEIAGIAPRGPAARAGLRVGDRLIHINHRSGETEWPVELSVKRGERVITLKYLPRGPTQRGPGWFRRPEITDAECQ